MKASIIVGSMALALTLAARPAHAQIVQAGIVVRSGPVYGHIIVGEPAPVVVYPEPAPRVIVAHPYTPRVIFLYYDGVRYYDRWYGRPGLRRVAVYERGGRYYRWTGGRDWYRPRYDYPGRRR
jgi:hypothetical protein